MRGENVEDRQWRRGKEMGKRGERKGGQMGRTEETEEKMRREKIEMDSDGGGGRREKYGQGEVKG